MSKYEKQSHKDIVAKNLNILLRQNNKSQVDIVNDLGMSQSIVSDYLTAKRYPPPDKMQMLADYFNVLMSDIMQEKPATNEGDGLDENQEFLIEIAKTCNAEQAKRLRKLIEAGLDLR